MKAAKSQQILPSDRKHVDPVGIGARQDGGESAVLTASVAARRGRFTSVYKSSAVGCETEDSRKNLHDAPASRLATRAHCGTRALARRRLLNLTSAG